MDISSVDQQRPLPVTVQQNIPAEELAQRQQLIQAVREVNKSEMLGENNELTFLFDRTTRRAIVRVIDRKTKDVVFQIPPDYVLRMAQELSGKS